MPDPTKESTLERKTTPREIAPPDIRERVFNARSYTPIPIAIAAVLLAETTWLTYHAGALAMLAGESLRIWAVGYAGSATRTTRGVGGEVLVVTGPFAHVKNPLYLGNFFISLGVCIMAWAWMPWMLLLYVALFVVQYAMIVSLEEEHLREQFGKEYAVYAAEVPRFVPRIPARPTDQVLEFRLGSAMRSERSTLGNMLLVAVVLGVRWALA